MSNKHKNKKYNYFKCEEKKYSDHENSYYHDEYINHKKEKRLYNALRSNNIDDLLSLELI